VFSQMVSEVLRPCMFTYCTLISGYAMLEMFNEANGVIVYMLEHESGPDELTYRTILDSYCKHKGYEDARNFIDRITETEQCRQGGV
jgi:pentatricopeptide repeat domain-containing protein 1